MKAWKIILGAIIAFGITGCSGGPSESDMAKTMDKNLDEAFASRNNNGNPFNIENVEITSANELENGAYDLVINMSVQAIAAPAKMAMSMTFPRSMMKHLGSLKQGQTADFQNIKVRVKEAKSGVFLLLGVQS